jgi:hypothetical protein
MGHYQSSVIGVMIMILLHCSSSFIKIIVLVIISLKIMPDGS